MSNWSGVYTNPNSIGISTGSNGSNTLNDTTANFPALNNQYVLITAGTGIGQEKQIAGTLATQITIFGSWDTIPDATSEYKIVLRLEDGDHIVGTIYLYPGLYSELEDNATIYIDGNYLIHIGNATEVLWNKSKDTVVTFEANNRDTQGVYGFWNHILFDNLATGIVKLSYLRIRDAKQGLLTEPSIALGDGLDVHHIISEECSSYPFGFYGNALLQDIEIKNFLAINCKLDAYYNNIENPYSITFEHFWLDGGINWYGSVSARTQILKDSVMIGMTSQSSTINNVDKKIYAIDNYLKGYVKDIFIIYPGAGEKGSIYSCRNVSKLGRDLLNASLEADLKMYSRYNDYVANGTQTYYAIENFATGAETIISHNDFIVGRKLGIDSNIDLTELTTSNHTPPMYKGLSSARTNAKATPNKLLELDNILESDLTSNSIKIKFDCKNSNTGTTVDQDSASGQKVLYVADTSEFEERETVEIGFGTARQETGIIDTIQAGVSITLKENLTYTHTLAQADTVTKRLRNIGLGFIRYGLSADNLDMATHIPDKSSWGFLYCGFKPDIEEDDGYEWKYTDLEVNLVGLKDGTQYYYQVCAYTPLGDFMEGVVDNFTTTPLSVNYTDPLEANVRDTITYKFDGVDKTGILDIPAEADVRDGTKYDNDTKEGVSDQALESDVRKDTIYDNGTKTGELEVSGVTEESIYNYFTDGSREDVFKADLTGLETLIKRILGLTQENFRIFNPTYDGNDNLLSATIKIYLTKADCDADTNAIATYSQIATYSGNNMSTYKITKD